MSDSRKNVTTGLYEVKYDFTREELRELGIRLATKAQEIYSVRADKKAAMKAFASQIEELENQTAALVRKLNERSESREVECAVHYHEPKKGVKTVIRLDTGEVAGEWPMTAAELQSSFVFDDAPKAPAKDKPKMQ